MKRLDCIANMIKPVDVLADIGTDHAYLPIALIREGKVQKAYACDVTQGPLAIAKEHIERENLADRIQPVLSDGFTNVPNDVQCVVIAGMGYHTIQSILEQAMDRLQNLQQIIVQSNNDVPQLREWIGKHRFTIDDEAVVHEKGHDYIVISFTCMDHEPYSQEECLLGPVLMKEPTEAFCLYCQRQAKKITFILSRRGDENPESIVLKRKRDLFNLFAQRIKKEDLS